MSGQRPPALDQGTEERTSSCPLCSHRFHRAASPGASSHCRTRSSSTRCCLRLSAETLIEVARNPKTPGRRDRLLQRAPHLDSENGASSARSLRRSRRRIVVRSSALGVCESALSVLSAEEGAPGSVFRGKVKDALRQAFAEGKIGFHGKLQHLSDPKTFHAFVRDLYRNDWVVHCKRPFGGPEHVLRYLGRYTHRVAISNHRLVSFENGEVTFTLERPGAWKRATQYDTARQRSSCAVFCFTCFQRASCAFATSDFSPIDTGALSCRFVSSVSDQHPMCPTTQAAETTGLWKCPKCGGPMLVTFRVNAPSWQPRSPPASLAWGKESLN